MTSSAVGFVTDVINVVSTDGFPSNMQDYQNR